MITGIIKTWDSNKGWGFVTDDDYVKYHPMFKAHTSYIYDTLDEGIDQIVDLFYDFVT